MVVFGVIQWNGMKKSWNFGIYTLALINLLTGTPADEM